MSKRSHLTEAEALEQYRVSLNNAEIQPEIAAMLAEFGYDSTTITEGKALLSVTRQAFDSNKIEDDETSAAYNKFKTLKQELTTTYKLHRKKAKVIFRKNGLVLEQLGLLGNLPSAHVLLLESAKRFYAVIIVNSEIKTKLARLKISETDLQNVITLIAAVEQARDFYLKEKGESQHATKLKDTAFSNMDDWMSEFYAIAKIALEDAPQLLESLGKLVRS